MFWFIFKMLNIYLFGKSPVLRTYCIIQKTPINSMTLTSSYASKKIVAVANLAILEILIGSEICQSICFIYFVCNNILNKFPCCLEVQIIVLGNGLTSFFFFPFFDTRWQSCLRFRSILPTPIFWKYMYSVNGRCLLFCSI